MQILPAIAESSERVVVLQRTPHWIAPVNNYFDRLSPQVHWLWDNVPFYFEWVRTRAGWNFNDKNYPSLVIDPNWEHYERSVNEINDFHRRYFIKYLESRLDGRPDLIQKSIPNYPPYGKRILLDNGWYEALRMPSVQLECDSLCGFTDNEVVTASGDSFELDSVVLCTGFQTSRYLYPMKIVGRNGIDLRESWADDDASAYLGVTAPGFPNLFFMYGPATNAGGGSFVSIAESQIRTIMQLFNELARRGARSIEPRSSASIDYNRRLDEGNERMVWSHPGMTTYVRNSKGRVTVNMPWRVVDYWAMMVSPDFEDYLFDGARQDGQ
jgi:4-hydroxyacetophenone monooxygenase